MEPTYDNGSRIQKIISEVPDMRIDTAGCYAAPFRPERSLSDPNNTVLSHHHEPKNLNRTDYSDDAIPVSYTHLRVSAYGFHL